jgi:hypothetical protein
MEVRMAVQVQVTWRVVGGDELEVTSEFGHLDPNEDDTEDETLPFASFEQVLEPESSTLASGLALQLA